MRVPRMTDRGTFIKYEAKEKGKPPLVILVEGDAPLKNQYGVITVNTAKCPKANAALAKKFADWITGAEGQKAVVGITGAGSRGDALILVVTGKVTE